MNIGYKNQQNSDQLYKGMLEKTGKFLHMGWVLDDSKESLLIFLGVIMASWLFNIFQNHTEIHTDGMIIKSEIWHLL